MKVSRCLILFLAASLAWSAPKVLSPELVVSIRNIGEVQLSPDGARIAFQTTRPRTPAEKPGAAIREIWMVPTAGGEPFRFTHNETDDRSPAWSPDGKHLAFLSQRGSSTSQQIYLIPAAGGDARQLTKGKEAVTLFAWSPDGSRIAYVIRDAKPKQQEDDEKAGKDWVVADAGHRQVRLHIVDVNTGESKLASQPLATVEAVAWAPDGKRLVVINVDTPKVDDAFMNGRLTAVTLETGDVKVVAKTSGKLSHPCWSPDGKWIAWLGATEFKDPAAGSVFAVPAAGGQAENLTPGYEGTAGALRFLPGKPDTVVVEATERQSSALWTMALSDRRRQRIRTSFVHVMPSFSADGARMAVAGNTAKHPNEIFYGETTGALRRLTRWNPQLDGVELGEQEEVQWKGPGAWTIEGVLVKPVGYEKGKRYPLVMQPHGGPESADRNGWLGNSALWGQMLAGRGFAVLYPNYRGSTGRGVEFSMADQKDLMGREFEDMLAGIEHVVKLGIADSARVGVGGGSYGGYTAAWAATFASERFKASVAWMGISDWFSMTGVSDIFLENSTVHWNAIMYDNYDLYLARSPIRYITKANTPTLIIHGAADPRVPIGQSQELYTALRWKGVPVEFVTYPREGHGVLETAHQLDFFNRLVAWYEKYLR